MPATPRLIFFHGEAAASKQTPVPRPRRLSMLEVPPDMLPDSLVVAMLSLSPCETGFLYQSGALTVGCGATCVDSSVTPVCNVEARFAPFTCATCLDWPHLRQTFVATSHTHRSSFCVLQPQVVHKELIRCGSRRKAVGQPRHKSGRESWAPGAGCVSSRHYASDSPSRTSWAVHQVRPGESSCPGQG